MKKYILYIATLFIALQSCQDVIDIEIPEGETRIIINGRITDSLPAEVRIYATVNFLSGQPNPPMSDALVELFENGEKVAELKEFPARPGVYGHPFVGTEGNDYHILVTFTEGHPYFGGTRWRSASERMNRVPPADSSYSKFFPRQPFIEEGYYAFIIFTEPAGLGDNYRVRLWRNDTLLSSAFDLTFFNDEFIDGFAFNDNPIPAVQIGSASKPGDFYKVELSSISSNAYKFFTILQQQTVQVGSTFDPPPAPIFGNITNADNPNKLGLGYFFASKLTYVEIDVVE